MNYYEANKDTVPHDELFARICAGGRDNARRPMPWDAVPQEGFWIPDYARRAQINAAADLASERSVYRMFQSLIALRKAEDTLKEGRFVLREATDRTFAFSRVGEDAEITLVCNLEESTPFAKDAYGSEVLLSNYPTVTDLLQPYQFVVIKAAR